MPQSIGIVGAGTIGGGIAHLASLARFTVSLYDVNETVILAATSRITAEMKAAADGGKISREEMTEALSRIHARTKLSELAHCEIVIEAVLEDLKIKRDLFRRLDGEVKPETLLATTSSTIPVTSIAAGLKKPERVVGLHFFPPVHRTRLAEVVRGLQSSEDSTSRGREFVERLGKTSVTTKDSPGYVVHRVVSLFYGEALRVLGEGIATAGDIDRIVKDSGGFSAGPFESMDLEGIDAGMALAQAIYDQSFQDPRYRPHPILKRMAEAGILGKKSGRGFFIY
ncbi:MAG TPA: 3-hydroxyacyl-CoA dehydrogenase NAD-binding domain-containing protein [Bacteroidota bacterium]|nr:3-hydroxyacyl-CoA dehydrogenase NAD-binding domain-containing protein [Bacteroidota bacterium]